MGSEEEVLVEVEAVEAVYGDDCTVLQPFPPHLHVHIMPRTADVSSQQFVEAVVGIRAGPQYPDEPPVIELVESKGLDEQRQKLLITSIQDEARQLTSCSMLVALCEEAVEKLSAMNHPEGDCPLCLHPLVPEDPHGEDLPFMKLMSCFHCFHIQCIVRWWNWLQKGKESNATSSSLPVRNAKVQDMHGKKGESMGNCPVCRKVFHTKDFEHVLDLAGTHSSEQSSKGEGVNDEEDDELLQSESESIRRQKFEAILKLQQENSGLIEPKRDLLVLPGMFLPPPAQVPAEMPNTDATDHHNDHTVSVDANSGGLPNRPGSMDEQQNDPTVTTVDANSSGSSNTRSSNDTRNPGRRKQRAQNSRKQVQQWVRR
ncbi:hypothetical protein Tsubulata_002712 [Turnera subulata]|uniref:RWD domain-containing protein n=1 Tax=Turnera subulata TaxID=218843 RepID=A0A9Q0GFU6_9ROSI|nr:hypothetical protein Tsubulata_002712 [Turnera subulata]